MPRHPLTPEGVKADALAHGYVPGTRVVALPGNEVVLTSYPWIETEGPHAGSVLIMARLLPDNPMSNCPIRYFRVMKRISEPGAVEL